MAEKALYMIPVGLSDADPVAVVPSANIEITRRISHFIVENVRTARRWLRKCDPTFSFDDVTFYELNRHTDPSDLHGMLQPLREGNPIGLMSEAGCPGVADPGADVVAMAQREGLRVIPLVGPSSILMSLMASGFNGQSFCFHGYLPIDETEKAKVIKRLERESGEYGRAQIFIETPYRNNAMVQFLCRQLHPETLLCIAANITDPNHESILVKSVREWCSAAYDYSRQPAIFLIQSPAVSMGHRAAEKNRSSNKPRKKR